VYTTKTTFAIELNYLNMTLGHAHFGGKLFVRPLGIPHTKLRTTFEFTSSSSFGDMFDRMPKIVGAT